MTAGDHVRILGVPGPDAWLVDEGHVHLGDYGMVLEVQPFPAYDGTDVVVRICRTGESWHFERSNLGPILGTVE